MGAIKVNLLKKQITGWVKSLERRFTERQKKKRELKREQTYVAGKRRYNMDRKGPRFSMEALKPRFIGDNDNMVRYDHLMIIYYQKRLFAVEQKEYYK